MCTKLVNKISGEEFYKKITLGRDEIINSEERLEQFFGLFYVYVTEGDIWCGKTKYPHTRSANDGLFEMELKSGENFYVLQECKLNNKDSGKALCQMCIYYNMELEEIRNKIKYFVIITPTNYNIFPVSALKSKLDEIAIIMDTIHITPCKVYENTTIRNLIVFSESTYEGAEHLNWRNMEDMGDIIRKLIDMATKDAIKEIENGNNNRRVA